MTPIFKKGARTKPENYRPVSLTSIPSKIMESIVRDGLMAHLEENSLINPSQHGFMSGREIMCDKPAGIPGIWDTDCG